MNKKYKKKFRVQTTRVDWHDYNDGAYFVTICTHAMVHYFGDIIDSQMVFSEIGKFADEQFRNVTEHYKYVDIPVWVIMPNHIHAIIRVISVETMCTSSLQQSCTSSLQQSCTSSLQQSCTSSLQQSCTSSLQQSCTSSLQQSCTSSSRWKDVVVNEEMQQISHKRGRLSTVVGGLKRAISHYANTKSISFKWQSRFHEHIIRNQHEMNRISKYIENNVVNWSHDDFCPEE